VASFVLYALAPPKRSDATYATDPGGAIACQHAGDSRYVVSVLASASLFGVLMYITPILENVKRLSADSVTLMLFLLGGRLRDWSLTP
jgi:predicted MFS family arabinose efflux permease